tara:strand:- start:610 stop:855 length:246 start_codon:yes stop_codon:yes gene_type:complete
MTLQEIYQAQNNKQKEVVVSVPELTHLVKHLDLMYSQLFKKEEKEQESEGQSLVEILGKPYIQTRAWYNPGQGIKQSAAVE